MLHSAHLGGAPFSVPHFCLIYTEVPVSRVFPESWSCASVTFRFRCLRITGKYCGLFMLTYLVGVCRGHTSSHTGLGVSTRAWRPRHAGDLTSTALGSPSPPSRTDKPGHALARWLEGVTRFASFPPLDGDGDGDGPSPTLATPRPGSQLLGLPRIRFGPISFYAKVELLGCGLLGNGGRQCLEHD